MEYPLYEMRQRADKSQPWEVRFVPLHTAGAIFDNGWCQVTIGGTVLLDDKGGARTITDADRQAISTAADEYSASK